MKVYLFIITLFIIFQPVRGQITFEKVYGASGYENKLLITNDNGYFLTLGNTLVLCDSLGDTLWTRTIQNIQFRESSQSLDSGFVVIGETNVYGAGKTDIVIVSLDKTGNIVWSKTYGGSQNDFASGIVQMYDGSIIFCGTSWSFNYDPFDTLYSNNYLIKINSFGDTLWTTSFGNLVSDGSVSVIETKDSNIMVLGWISSYISFGEEIFLSKFDQNGNRLWSSNFGGPYYDYGSSIFETLNGDFIISGMTPMDTGYHDTYVVRTDSLGNILWAKTYGTLSDDAGGDIIEALDSDLIILNRTWVNDTVDVIRANSVGDTLWTK